MILGCIASPFFGVRAVIGNSLSDVFGKEDLTLSIIFRRDVSPRASDVFIMLYVAATMYCKNNITNK